MFKFNDCLNNRYQLQKQLGQTAKGRQTWSAFDTISQETVVIKLLAFAPQMEWGELDLFERESRILQALNHPCIPEYRDYFDLDQNQGYGISWFCLVQEYIEGKSLQDLLAESKKFTESEIIDIAKQILEILAYLHKLNPPVLHRDIKPSNLILGTDNKIYLVDFGAVQDQAKVTGMTFTVVGTSGYVPMEQFSGRAVPASDLYALGATIIHLLTGIEPMNLTRKNSQLQFSHLVNVSNGLVNWLHNLTTLDVESRPKNAEDALRRLKNINSKIIFNPSKELKKSKNNDVTQVNISEEKLEIFLPDKNHQLLMLYKTILFVVIPVIFALTFCINNIFGVNTSNAISIEDEEFWLLLICFVSLYGGLFLEISRSVLKDEIIVESEQITILSQRYNCDNQFINKKLSININNQLKIFVVSDCHRRGRRAYYSHHLKIENGLCEWKSLDQDREVLESLVVEVNKWLESKKEEKKITDLPKRSPQFNFFNLLGF